MVRQHCTGAGLLDAIRSAVANLERHVDEINALNVFPVPDGDTGTNMLATVRAALDEAEVAGRDAPAERVAAAVSHGALMGARGNSGVITSQIFRGMAEALSGKRRFNGLDLAHALTEGARTAYGAVAKPVEGTILTVIRESAAGAVEAASDTIAIGLLQAAFQARVVVPDQLSIVGFDDIDSASFTIPPLTTVSQSGVEMGRTAAHMLLDMIESTDADRAVPDVVVAPSLVVRQSTAPRADGVAELRLGPR